MVASPFYRQKAKPKAANCLPVDTPVYLLGTSENSERENYCYKEKKRKKKENVAFSLALTSGDSHPGTLLGLSEDLGKLRSPQLKKEISIKSTYYNVPCTVLGT